MSTRVHFNNINMYNVLLCCSQSQEMSSPLLTQTVRKDLAMAIRDLAQHGLMEVTFELFFQFITYLAGVVDSCSIVSSNIMVYL